MENVSYIAAFFAGFATFLSPCILPLLPAYISYLTGISFQEISGELTKERKRKIKVVTAFHALSFILGFSVIFILLGMGITFIGAMLLEYQSVLRRIGGLLIIFFGLVIMGVVKLSFMQKEKKFSYRKGGVSFLGSVLVGATFATAWTPCVGPILGSILVYASSTASLGTGAKLLATYSLGLGMPFFLSALAINSFLAYLRKIEKFLRWTVVFAGGVLIVFGALLLIRG